MQIFTAYPDPLGAKERRTLSEPLSHKWGNQIDNGTPYMQLACLEPRRMKVLTIDVGGTHVKVLSTGRKKPVVIRSGPRMTPAKMVAAVVGATSNWKYEAISMGYPGFVVEGRPITEPFHLGPGWVAFNYAQAFGYPIKIVNDAALQALGSYQGGRMLFLGLGTGLGSALIVNKHLQPMELAHLPFKKGRTFEDYLGLAGLRRQGEKKWRNEVQEAALHLKSVLRADYVVLGGGNARLLTDLPKELRLGNNDNAFLGGHRLWTKSFGDSLRI